MHEKMKIIHLSVINLFIFSVRSNIAHKTI